jgi:hypothetical protein
MMRRDRGLEIPFLTGELLEFREVAEAIEYQQTLGVNSYRDNPASATA